MSADSDLSCTHACPWYHEKHLEGHRKKVTGPRVTDARVSLLSDSHKLTTTIINHNYNLIAQDRNIWSYRF